MKLTKLAIVQMVLSALDLDEVSYIAQGVDSEQVGMVVDSVYDDLNGDQPWPHLRAFEPLEVTSTANVMKMPDDVMTLNNIWYNAKRITYITPIEMEELLMKRDTTASNIDSNGAYNDKDPLYWTSLDDTYITFDAYDGSLMASYSKAEVYKMPAQMTQDTDYPDLPERFHQTLYHGVLADCFYNLKADTTGFNIYRNRFKREKSQMERWAKRVNRKQSLNEEINYGRKWA